MDHLLTEDDLAQDILNEEISKHLERKKDRKEKFWGNLSKFLVLAYVFLGGGYEIYVAILNHHVQASFILSFTSALIFTGRVFYALYSGATRTMWADICGVIIMLTLFILHIIINGTLL